MSAHPPNIPSKDSIRAQLRELGYANVPDEVLDDFMIDLAKLYQSQPTTPADSYGWSTEESDYEQRNEGRRNTAGIQHQTRQDSRQEAAYRDYQQQYPLHPHSHSSRDYQPQPPRPHSHSSHNYQPQPPRDQRTTQHPPQHRHVSYSESEYEPESNEEGLYDGDAYMPSDGIHISPHQQHYSTDKPRDNRQATAHHYSGDEKENYYDNKQQINRQDYYPTSRQTTTTHRQNAPPHRQQQYQNERDRRPVYESDYTNDEYASDPYYSDAPYHYTSARNNEEYYSEDDTKANVSRPLSSMSNESRYPGGKPNSSGVIWTRKSEHGRAFPKSDPVSRHQQVQRAWSQDPFLRSQASNKNPKVHIPYEPPWKPPRKDLSLMRPDYVVPTEKRRDSLRFNVRAKMMS